MNNYIIGAIMFAVGMSFQHSMIGDHARYGVEVMQVIDRCERNEGRECDIIAAPVFTSYDTSQPIS